MSVEADELGEELRSTVKSDTRELHPLRSRPRTSEQPRAAESDPERALLVLACTLPFQETAASLTRQCIDTFARIWPDLAVGACLVDIEGGPRLVYGRVPGGGEERLGSDPTRLFASFAFERVFALDVDLGGSTLHFASDDPRLARAEGALAALGERAALVLSGALRRARVYRQAQRAGRDRPELQAQLIQAEKMASLGQLVAGVVHELNNPLTSIVAYSDYLKKKLGRGQAGPDDIERLGRINEAAERILKFSRDLVAYAKPAVVPPHPVPLSTIVDKALVFCEHEFASNGVEVQRDFAEPLPKVRGVPGQLTQVFVNLFTNAAQAMATQGGRLLVQLRHEPDSGVLLAEVGDQGVGIEADDLTRVFEPFFTKKSDGRGTGLGLSIVREIVTAHGGSISVRSAPGAGTTFTLVLPVSAE